MTKVDPVYRVQKTVITYSVIAHDRGGESGIVLGVDEAGTVHLDRYYEVESNRYEIGRLPFHLLPALHAAVGAVLEAAGKED